MQFRVCGVKLKKDIYFNKGSNRRIGETKQLYMSHESKICTAKGTIINCYNWADGDIQEQRMGTNVKLLKVSKSGIQNKSHADGTALHQLC